MSEGKESEGEKKFVERILTVDPNRFKPAPENLSKYQKKVRRDQQAKVNAKRQERREPSAPYPSNPSSKSQPKSLSTDQERALKKLAHLDNEREISDVKRVLDVTPSKPVPDGINPFTPTELKISERREEEVYQPSALNLNEHFETDLFEIDPNDKIFKSEEKGGRKRKSRKLRKSKKSRKSKRKTTRKNRRHRRR